MSKRPESNDIELSYGDHLKDLQERPNDGTSSVYEQDEREIRRMGKRSQFKRVHTVQTMFATSASIQASWQVLLASLNTGLANGGTGGVWFTFIFTAIVAVSNVLSIAEYASIMPINGGQYHWISEFAPKYGKQLSYFGGWWSTIAWQSTAAGATFLAGSFIPSLAALFHPDYVPTAWHNNLCVFALLLLILAINATSTKPLIYIQMIAMVILFIGWMPLVGCLGGLAPHPKPFREVITTFSSDGYSNIGLAVLVGQICNVYALTSFDAAAHMVEEVTNAGRAVPKAILFSYMGNASVAFIVLSITLWSMPDLAAALDSPTGFAFIHALQQAGTQWAQAITAIVVLIAFAGCTGCNAAASRETAAFARDKGLPASAWLSKVTKATHPPRNAVFLTCFITFALTCINFGSSIAFNAIISGQLIALNVSYAVTHACALCARYTGKFPRHSRWSLGRIGAPANAIALVYDVFLVIFLAFPPVADVDAASFNWGSIIFIITNIFALGFYMTSGKKQYRDPKKDVVV